LSAALQETTSLKLEKATGPLDAIIVDSSQQDAHRQLIFPEIDHD